MRVEQYQILTETLLYVMLCKRLYLFIWVFWNYPGFRTDQMGQVKAEYAQAGIWSAAALIYNYECCKIDN